MLDLSKILITGAAGMLGRHADFGIKLSRADLDIRDTGKMQQLIEHYQASGIINFAALDLRQSIAQGSEVLPINSFAPYQLAKLAASYKIKFVQISSAIVFSGRYGESFDEDMQPNPLNIYAQTKYAAELLVSSVNPDALIVRTGWVFGGHAAHHKKFVDTVIESIGTGAEIKATTDQSGSPTYIADFFAALKQVTSEDHKGLLHIVNADPASAYETASEIAKILDKPANITACKIVQDAHGLERSESEYLVSKFLKLRTWRESLREYVLTRSNRH